jgi:hypothetical protein
MRIYSVFERLSGDSSLQVLRLVHNPGDINSRFNNRPNISRRTPQELRQIEKSLRLITYNIPSTDADIIDHSDRVAHISEFLLLLSGISDQYSLLLARYIGKLHDVGKSPKEILELIRIPNIITDEEREVTHRHPLEGKKIIMQTARRVGLKVTSTIKDVAWGILTHHLYEDEKGGYPLWVNKTKFHKNHAEHLAKIKRVIKIADPLCAMLSCRPYRQDPLTDEQIISELDKYSGEIFGPEEVILVKTYLPFIRALHQDMYFLQESAAVKRITGLNSHLSLECEQNDLSEQATMSQFRVLRKKYYNDSEKTFDHHTHFEHRRISRSAQNIAERYFAWAYQVTQQPIAAQRISTRYKTRLAA